MFPSQCSLKLAPTDREAEHYANSDSSATPFATEAQEYHDRGVEVQGLKYISDRDRRNGEKMTQAGLALRLEGAQALLALDRLDEAVDAFSLLKKWTSDGEITFPYVAGIMPTSVRQQAARGLAQVLSHLNVQEPSLPEYFVSSFSLPLLIHTRGSLNRQITSFSPRCVFNSLTL